MHQPLPSSLPHAALLPGPVPYKKPVNLAELYAVCPPLPTSPKSLHTIKIAQLALRFFPISLDLVDNLAKEFNDVELARVAAVKKFMNEVLKMGSDVMQQVTLQSAWSSENEHSLIVKFSSKLDIDIVNSFKKSIYYHLFQL